MKNNSYLFFKVLSTELRAKIIDLLYQKPRTVSQITKELNTDQSKISHNLQKLSLCNIVTSKRKGKTKIYSLNKKTITPILDLVNKHFCTLCVKECKAKEEYKWKYT